MAISYVFNPFTGNFDAINGSLVTLLPTVQKFLSGSGTYVLPTNPSPVYIEVEMVGGGGGGQGGGSSAGTIPTDGGDTTFGSSLLVAGGGIGQSVYLNPAATPGGSASLGTGPVGIALPGGSGGGYSYTGASTNTVVVSGSGGSSGFGGNGGSAGAQYAGGDGAVNTGGGGGGGGSDVGVNMGSGAGGGAGGYIKALISSPASTYPYSVGAAGTAGGAGPLGYPGGAGGSGVIIVKEYYSNGGTSPVYTPFVPTPPTSQILLSTGTTTGYIFSTLGTVSVTAGAVYQDGNGSFYTVLSTLVSAPPGSRLFTSGAILPVSGPSNLALISGTGPGLIGYTGTPIPLATYTTPVGATSIRVKLIGGGGGGAGSGTGGQTLGGNGSTTLFGYELLIGEGGEGGSLYAGVGQRGAMGGAASLGAGPVGIAIRGSGGGSGYTGNNGGSAGSPGPFGGAGAAGNDGSGSGDGYVNSGAGGGGGAAANAAATTGGGGASGGYVDVRISSPNPTYVYIVGDGGLPGGAGTLGSAGGYGGSGMILVEEFY